MPARATQRLARHLLGSVSRGEIIAITVTGSVVGCCILTLLILLFFDARGHQQRKKIAPTAVAIPLAATATKLKDDFTNIQTAVSDYLPERLHGLKGELDNIKQRLREQLQNEIKAEKEQLAAQWEKIKHLKEHAADAASKTTGALGDQLGDKVDGLKGRLGSLSLPEPFLRARAEIDKTLGGMSEHMPSIHADAIKEKLHGLLHDIAEEREKLNAQWDTFNASKTAAAAVAATGAAVSSAFAAAVAFSSGGSTVVADVSRGGGADMSPGGGTSKLPLTPSLPKTAPPPELKASVEVMAKEAWASAAGRECHSTKLSKLQNKEYAGQLSKCKATGFVDEKFPASPESICYAWNRRQEGKLNAGEDVGDDWSDIKWKRPREFLRPDQKPQVFVGTIAPTDVEQGKLGDCYLLSALAVLAERPETIRALFVSEKEKPELGLYVVRLCVQGTWNEVVVSDEIPCVGGDPLGGPIFSKSKDGELWVLLIEKAWAKLFTSYQHIIGGSPGECMTNLTGAPYTFIASTKPTLWLQIYKATANESEAASKGWFVCALINANAVSKFFKDKNVTSQNKLGLVEGHAYSILDARKISGTELLQLRNPWGNTEWSGAWSDNDKARWTPEARAQLGRTQADLLGKNDGTFWMSVENFCNFFAGVQICRSSQGWEQGSEELALEPGKVGVLLLTVTGKASVPVDLAVHQKDKRHYLEDKRYTPATFKYVSVRMMVVAAESGEVAAHCCLESRRDVDLEMESVKPGKYWILIESDWDGSPGLQSDDKSSITVGVSCRHDPTGGADVSIIAPAVKVDGRALKVWAYRQMCELAKGGQLTRYDSDFRDVAEAAFLSKAHYDAGDSYAWLWRNDSKTLVFTEEVTFAMKNLVIEGMPAATAVKVGPLKPGESQLVLLVQVSGLLSLQYSYSSRASVSRHPVEAPAAPPAAESRTPTLPAAADPSRKSMTPPLVPAGPSTPAPIAAGPVLRPPPPGGGVLSP